MSLTTQSVIIPICCVCGLIREHTTPSKAESWVNKGVFRRTHGKDLAAYRLTHTYCPTCYSQFMSRIAAA
jgi:hypothetical protein